MERVLIIGFVWPEPNSSAAGSRIMQLLALFKEQGSEIIFSSAAMDSEFAINLHDFGISKVKIELNSTSFDDFLEKFSPTLVLFDRFMTEEMFGWRVAKHCPSALRILDTEDLHCLRIGRHNALKENRAFSNKDLFSDVAKREIASILRCDVSLMISDFEIDLLQNFFKVDSDLVYHLPFLLDKIDRSTWPDFKDREDFVFIGNFLHEPNWDAVQYLKASIWPLIKTEIPSAVLRIYGAYPSQKVQQLHNVKEGFIIMGRAKEAHEVIQNAKIMLAPLRFGAGIKGKLVDAMRYGTPSVTTSIGIEGMKNDRDWNGCVEDNAENFANAAIDLYQNQSNWEKAQQNGIRLYHENYDKETYAPKFIDHLTKIIKNLQKHRAQNFIGAMLFHHSMASTKYMARWIEAKNKLI